MLTFCTLNRIVISFTDDTLEEYTHSLGWYCWYVRITRVGLFGIRLFYCYLSENTDYVGGCGVNTIAMKYHIYYQDL